MMSQVTYDMFQYYKHLKRHSDKKWAKYLSIETNINVTACLGHKVHILRDNISRVILVLYLLTKCLNIEKWNFTDLLTF